MRIFVSQKQIMEGDDSYNDTIFAREGNDVYKRNPIGVWEKVANPEICKYFIENSGAIDLVEYLEGLGERELELVAFQRTAPIYPKDTGRQSESLFSYISERNERNKEIKDISYMEEPALCFVTLPNGAMLKLSERFDVKDPTAKNLSVGVLSQRYTNDGKFTEKSNGMKINIQSVISSLKKELETLMDKSM